MVILLFELGEQSREIVIVETNAQLVVGVRSLSQAPVEDVSGTSERTSKYSLLFIGRIEPILVGTFVFHILHDSKHAVKSQQERWSLFPPSPPTKEAAFIPNHECWGLLPQENKTAPAITPAELFSVVVD